MNSIEHYYIYQKLDGLDGLQADWIIIAQTDNINYIDKLAEGFAKVTNVKSGIIKYDIGNGLQYVLIKEGPKYAHEICKEKNVK